MHPSAFILPMIHVLYLDRYHLGDPLFLNGFARDVLGLDAPCVLVHGAGEAAERALEAQGRFPEFEGGVLAVETEADRALVARAARDLNRQIAHTLNDAGVAAVRLEASGRGLIRATSDGFEAGNTGWLRGIVAQGAVPVIAALVGEMGGAVREANGGAVAGTLARAFADEGTEAQVVFLTKNGQNGLVTDDSVQAEVALEAVSAALVAEPEAVRRALAAGAEVVVTGRSGLRQTPLVGTRIREVEPKKSA
jgi:isopentenyl phosphate kinase